MCKHNNKKFRAIAEITIEILVYTLIILLLVGVGLGLAHWVATMAQTVR